MTDLLATLSQAKGRWMIGGSAIDVVPEAWRKAVEGDERPEIALLTLAGQASLVALRAKPSKPPERLPELPRLSKPPLEDALRPLFRRVMEGTPERHNLLHLLAARGRSVHPADYMPSNFDALPDLYDPWADWRSQSTAEDTDPEEDLTAENWDNWMPSERRRMLQAMRGTQPDEARSLMEACASRLSADHRQRVIETLAIGLSEADAEYLSALCDTDRSGKVRSIAGRLLARLGQGRDDAEKMAELADFYQVKTEVKLKKLKTSAQRNRAEQLLQEASLSGFAAALGLDQVALVEVWSGNLTTTTTFINVVAATGSDAACHALAQRMGSGLVFAPGVLAPLAQRLPHETRQALLPRAIEDDAPSFAGTRDWAQGMLGRLDMDLLRKSGPYKDLLASVSEQSEQSKQRELAEGLTALGFLVSAEAAQEIIDQFTKAGLFSADPSLGLLTLNASLRGDPT